MGKHKLNKNKRNRKTTRKKIKKKTDKKKNDNKIIDVPLSKNISKGSKASLGSINYHYQKYYNTFAFIKEVTKRDKTLKNRICIPDIGEDWMKSFLKIELMENDGSIKSIKPVDSTNKSSDFIKEITRCMKHRLIPINLEIIIPRIGTHANIILIDTQKKTIELFEPHGNREKSELENVSRAYYKVSKNIERFFKFNFPDYKYIPPSSYEPKKGLQVRLDAYSGLCVTWSILYLHYRLLNPNVSQKKLVTYLDKKVTRNFILRYMKYIEDILKGKI